MAIINHWFLWQKLTYRRRATYVKLPPKEARKILRKKCFQNQSKHSRIHCRCYVFDSSLDLEFHQAVIWKLNVFANKIIPDILYPVIEYLPCQSCQLNFFLPYLKIAYNAKLQYCIFSLLISAKMEELFHLEITNSCSNSFYICSLYASPVQKSLWLHNTCP